jgi:2-methylcitrate dehydratase PrpD
MAAGLRVNFGSMTKALHSGWAAHAASRAVDLAGAGLTSSAQALEAPAGFVATFGQGADGAKVILDRVGAPWVFEQPGVALRLYPCHGASHKALDAALLIHAEAGTRPDGIAAVRSYNPPPWFRWMPPRFPRTGLEGRYSFNYILATALADGYVNLTSFTDEAVRRPEVLALMDRIEVFEDPAYFDESQRRDDDPTRPPYEGWIRLEVVTTDGRAFVREVAELPGSPARPAGWDIVGDKFADLCRAGGVPADQARTTLAELRELDSHPDLAAVLQPLARDR